MPYDNDASREEKRSDADKRPGETDGKPERRDDAEGKAGQAEKPDAEKKPRSPLIWIVLGIGALIAIGGGTYYWYSTKDQESTDDAFTDGDAITIAPKIAGYVTELNVTDNQPVHAGDILLRIDQRDYVAARDQAKGVFEAAEAQLASSKSATEVARKNFPARLQSAQAQRDSARAGLIKAQNDAKRQRDVAAGATTQTAIDQANAALLQAQANLAQAEAAVTEAEPVQANISQSTAQISQITGQLDQARAQLAQAEINLTYTVISAPQDGWVTKRNVERGSYEAAGASVMSLVTPNVWVTANFKESQLDRMRKGQKVDIAVDAYPNLKLRGHIDSLQLGTGSKFTAFPPENATGNFVKIVQRVPVKIVIDEGLDPNLPLPLGISVTPTVLFK